MIFSREDFKFFRLCFLEGEVEGRKSRGGVRGRNNLNNACVFIPSAIKESKAFFDLDECIYRFF